VHDGSFGFVLQSTGGGVPVVQLPAHVDPVPFPPDAATVMLFGGIGDVVTCSFASPRSQSLVGWTVRKTSSRTRMTGDW
jgi:hypothetical protein